MRKEGIIIFSTDEARKNYVKKEKKDKKTHCPSCEIDLRNKRFKYCIDKEITEDILKN
jgi:hypothetical protein